LDEFLATSDPNFDSEDGHPMAYEAILRESAKFEATPLFLREDSNPVVSDPVLSAVVPEWLAKARQVATGNRRRVLEDERDVPDSSDEDDPNMKPDTFEGAYTAEMDPKAGPKVLSPAQAAYQKAAGMAIASLQKSEPDRQPTPLTSTANSEDEGMSEDQCRQVKVAKKMAARSAPQKKAPYAERIPDSEVQKGAKGASFADTHSIPSGTKVDKSVTRSRAVTDSTPVMDGLKAVSSQGEPAGQPKGTKVPPPTKGHQAPTHPMETRKRTTQGSRAGGFRPGVGGSGQMDTCVASSHPSQT
jgi:hypothetical protein